MEQGEIGGKLITALGGLLGVSGLLLLMALSIERRVLDLDPRALVVREDFSSGAFESLTGVGMGLGIGLAMLVYGGLGLLRSGSRWTGALVWLLSFLPLYFALSAGRDAITFSELRIDSPSKTASCNGYILGRRVVSMPMLSSQINLVSFPPGSGGRFGVQVGSATTTLCSLHNRLLDREETLKLAQALKLELGEAKVRMP